MTPFARIVMTGLGHLGVGPEAREEKRRDLAVLRLGEASTLAAHLGAVINRMARSSRTPTIKASGVWSWTNQEPEAVELLVTDTLSGEVDSPENQGAARLVRAEFRGTLVRHLGMSDPPVEVRGAVFSGPRQAQALAASLNKLVRSSLARQRHDVYVHAEYRDPGFRM
jgi:hypothetical protein